MSDATNLKSKAFVPTNHDKALRKRNGSESEEANVKTKKNLSPIIEATPREDYFSSNPKNEQLEAEENKENVVDKSKSDSVTEKLKEYIDEIDSALYKETGVKVHHTDNRKKPDIVIIDVDSAEKISRKNKQNSTIGKKLKLFNNKKNKKKVDNKNDDQNPAKKTPLPSSKIKKVINTLERQSKRSPEMIHSSQKPAEKPPLTKGRTVDSMVKRLSYDNSPPPPKTNVMVAPNVSVQHNNNQPFSYTRGLSPENDRIMNPGSPVIYAQVVCEQNGTGSKQTIHTAYTNGKKHLPHSDSDEGLGYEENTGFGRKYEPEKNMRNITRFGDEPNDFFNEDEYPITPKFKHVDYNNFRTFENEPRYHDHPKTEHKIFIDSSSRGRGDGMDSKRRESLTENFENLNISSKHYMNGRSDLSARRDLLESRMTRRFGDKQPSPEYPLRGNVNNIRETLTTKYYKSGSASPVGFREKYVSETHTDKNGKPQTTESRSRRYFGEEDHENIHKRDYRYNGFESEPKSFDSQLSDYRSSPENIRIFEASPHHSNKYKHKSTKQITKNKDHYKSNPEINQNCYKYDDREYRKAYHDSLKREKINSTKRYFDQTDERKDRFGDSGIENDFRRDSGESFPANRSNKPHEEFCNESEDEGFASSLLIASERQHTEDNFARKQKREYDSDKSYHREEPFRNLENMEYKSYKSKERHEYAPRERSIDDGSHFDPRIDKDFDQKGTLKKVSDKKPPKPEKKSGLEKVRPHFFFFL